MSEARRAISAPKIKLLQERLKKDVEEFGIEGSTYLKKVIYYSGIEWKNLDLKKAYEVLMVPIDDNDLRNLKRGDI